MEDGGWRMEIGGRRGGDANGEATWVAVAAAA
jgi:hypothetical protein